MDDSNLDETGRRAAGAADELTRELPPVLTNKLSTDAGTDAAMLIHEGANDEGAAAVVAGTLCLMSCFSQHPLPLYAQRVADNLHRLAANPAMTPELRSVCRRLSCQWDGIADDALRSVDLGLSPADCRPLH